MNTCMYTPMANYSNPLHMCAKVYILYTFHSGMAYRVILVSEHVIVT